MSTGAVIGIVVAIIVVIAVVTVVAMEMRRRKLRKQFGPEYDRTVSELGSRRKAEAELASRQRRVAKLDIRPLTSEESARYRGEWQSVQERFVDTPTESVAQAATLITSVMQTRGYPVDDRDEAMDALSVEHASTLGRYREAQQTSERAASGEATTDDLRNAMLQYRALFHELVGEHGDDAPASETAASDTATSAETGRTAATSEVPATAGSSATDTPEAPVAADRRATADPAAEDTRTGDGTPVNGSAPAEPVVGEDAVSPQRSRRR